VKITRSLDQSKNPKIEWKITSRVTSVRTILHSKASASLAYESQTKILHHKELKLGSRNNYKWRENLYSLRGLWFSDNQKMLQVFVRELPVLQTLIKCKSLW